MYSSRKLLFQNGQFVSGPEIPGGCSPLVGGKTFDTKATLSESPDKKQVERPATTATTPVAAGQLEGALGGDASQSAEDPDAANFARLDLRTCQNRVVQQLSLVCPFYLTTKTAHFLYVDSRGEG